MSEFTITPQDSGKKLIAVLSHHYTGQFSARSLKQAIEQNRCRVNGRVERFASFVVGTGDHISLDLTALSTLQEPKWVLDKDRILFEDDSLIAYDKPAGISCDAEAVFKATGLILLHRLDKETTGVLLLAKNDKAAKGILDQFKQRLIKKCYCAIVDGALSTKSGVIENGLVKKKVYQGQTLWGEVDKKQGLYAYTAWQCVQSGKDASLVHCFPKTGRMHQLRVHLAGIGHPILGDYQYGKRFQCSHRPSRYLLHALEVEFSHPVTGKKMRIAAPMPEDFVSIIKRIIV